MVLVALTRPESEGESCAVLAAFTLIIHTVFGYDVNDSVVVSVQHDIRERTGALRFCLSNITEPFLTQGHSSPRSAQHFNKMGYLLPG